MTSAPSRGWSGADASVQATTFVLVRHGATPLTERKVFSGAGGEDPVLSAVGIAQAERAAAYAAEHYALDALVTSPMARARQTAEHIAAVTGLEPVTDARLREADFGAWEGSTFAEISQRWPSELSDWLASPAVAPPGGEAFEAVYARTLEARDALLEQYAGRTVAVVSHVGVIKMLMVAALATSMDVIYRLELAPASFTTVHWWGDGRASVRDFSVVPR